MSIEKDLRFNIKVRVYGNGLNTSISHAYCVDDHPLGVSAPIGNLVIDVRSVNLIQLRAMIQYDKSGHMNRRNIIFQEALFIMSRLPNLFDRATEDLTKYRLGFLKKDNFQVKLIDQSRESEPISSLIGATDFFLHDLIIIPLSQIPSDIEHPKIPNEVPQDISTSSDEKNNADLLKPRGKSRQRNVLEEARISADRFSQK